MASGRCYWGTFPLHLLLRDRSNPGAQRELSSKTLDCHHQSVSDAEWNDALSIGLDLLFSGEVSAHSLRKTRSFS